MRHFVPARSEPRVYSRPGVDGAQVHEPDSYDWYLEQMGRPECEPLSRADERALGIRVQTGDAAAREALTTHNLRLVIAIARKFIGRGVELLDLISAGNAGLMAAVGKYDASRGNRFSTMATYWIMQACQRCVEHEATGVRLPAYMHTRAKREKRVALSFVLRPLSLDEPMKAEKGDYRDKRGEDVTLYSLIEDGEANVEQQVEDASAQPEAFRELVRLFAAAKLSAREQRILALRYAGDEGGQAMTLAQVSRVIGVTRERVRQIEAGALGKLRQAAGVLPAPAAEQVELWAS